MHAHYSIALCQLGRELNLTTLKPLLLNEFSAQQYRDAFVVQIDQGEIWLFDYGIIVSWNVSHGDRESFIDAICGAIIEPAKKIALEHYKYTLNPDAPISLKHDLINLPNNDPLTRLALSHAFAQSYKLSFFEDQAQRVIQENTDLSKTLAVTGTIPLNRKALAKLRGRLFCTTSDIILHFNLLDTPEFFWDYPEYEPIYQLGSKYLELAPRLEILNQKLDTIQTLLDMLSQEQNHKHSAFLEWIIIILIAVDILIYFFPKEILF